MSAQVKQDISTYKIHLWNTYNTLDLDDYKCKGIQKNGNMCGKKCTYRYPILNNYQHCCKIHFPKELIHDKIIDKKYMFKKKAINDYLLQDIAKIVLQKIQDIYNENYDLFDGISQVLIELQPKVNQKMKFISHILYGKFVELYVHKSTTIRFVRASQKLKAYTGPMIECNLKGHYAKRKWLSIQYTKWFLEHKFIHTERDIWLHCLEQSGKKDDLCDVMLMAINGYYGIPKKQITNKKGKCIK